MSSMRVSNEFNFFEEKERKKMKKLSAKEKNQPKKIIPVENINKFSSHPNPPQKKEHEEKSAAGTLQNGEITEFYFQKLIHIEYQLCLVVFLNLFLIAISVKIVLKKSMISFPDLKDFDVGAQTGCLYFCLTCVIIECLLLGFRTMTVLQLQKEQKTLYEKSTIYSTKKIFEYVFECSIMLIQPYPFFSQINIWAMNSYNLTHFQLPFNDILTVVSVLRIYVFVRAGLILTSYQNTRCNFWVLSSKQIVQNVRIDNPLILIAIFFTISSVIFAFQIYLVQRRAAFLAQDPTGMCDNFFNSLWLILMTITTVGYGDYFPHTEIGRIIILIVAIWGTFIVSMMVVVVSNTLKMQKNEKRTSFIINKLQLRREIEKQAKKLVCYFMLKKRHEKIRKDVKQKLKNSKDLKEKKKLQQIASNSKKLSQTYSSLSNYAEKKFSKLRKQVKGSQDIEDIEDEVSSHFLHVNGDIEILNKNQQKIISFIHEYLEFNGKNKRQKDKAKNEENQNFSFGKDSDGEGNFDFQKVLNEWQGNEKNKDIQK